MWKFHSGKILDKMLPDKQEKYFVVVDVYNTNSMPRCNDRLPVFWSKRKANHYADKFNGVVKEVKHEDLLNL